MSASKRPTIAGLTEEITKRDEALQAAASEVAELRGQLEHARSLLHREIDRREKIGAAARLIRDHAGSISEQLAE